MYERFTFRGATLDRMTIAALLCAEKRLGYSMTIIQGSYNRGGVGASGGTHDGGGAVDLVWFDIRRKNRQLRKANFAGWPRRTLPGEWSRHWHGILIGNDKASPEAKDQVRAYRNGRDGLASNGPDTWWRPKKIGPFRYGKRDCVSWRRLNRIAKHPKGMAFMPSGARQVEVVARSLRGFNMDMQGRHRAGRMDKALIDAIHRFRRIRHVGETEVEGILTPKVCYELCIPTVEED
ncbi:MAG TPA: hypothetical protein VEX15_06255 [Nocardioidaceae bacterium]|nr:hypothetical protein [Nocardioidaceae bacterium]